MATVECANGIQPDIIVHAKLIIMNRIKANEKCLKQDKYMEQEMEHEGALGELNFLLQWITDEGEKDDKTK